MTPLAMNNLLGQLPFQAGAVTRMINAENPTGEKGGAAKWDPNPEDPFLAHSGPAAHLGRGWKVRPFISLKAGETATLADIQGHTGRTEPSVITCDGGRRPPRRGGRFDRNAPLAAADGSPPSGQSDEGATRRAT